MNVVTGRFACETPWDSQWDTGDESAGCKLFGTGYRLAVTVALLFLLSAGARVWRLDAPGVLVEREINSAIVARDVYFRHAAQVAPWRRELARAIRANQVALEPPVTEWLVAGLYTLAGRENLRYAKVLTSLFWLLGGGLLFAIAKAISSQDAAVLATAYYLFLPMGILLGRSFQPDALMMLLFLAALLAVVRYHQSPSAEKLAAAALLAAVTFVYRPLVLFALLGAFIVPLVQKLGARKGLLARPVLVFASSALPAVITYGHGWLVAGAFAPQVEKTLHFGLYAHREYWEGWVAFAVRNVGLAGLVAAAAGVAFLRRGLPRSLVAGLAMGYVALGLLFTMHIHTHEYYHAQLIPLVALAGAPVAAHLVRRAAAQGAWLKWIVPGLVLALLVPLGAREVQQRLNAATYGSQPEVDREIGQLVGHSQRVVFVAPYYGLPLQYFGEVTGVAWPRAINYWLYRKPGERALTVAERLQAIPFHPEFFVVTAFEEFDRHHADLAAHLHANCTLKAKSPEYLVFERCRPALPAAAGGGGLP